MSLLEPIEEELASLESALLEMRSLGQAAALFQDAWREAGRQAFEDFMQNRIVEVESGVAGSRQIRSKAYHTPIGTIRLERRVFDTPEGSRVPADETLGLPKDSWLPTTLELACALGAMSEFPNANRLFERWSGVAVDERTLANQVEWAGAALQQAEFAKPLVETAGPDSALTKVVAFAREKPRVYVEMDGILTPANAGQGYKEALVGVVFLERDHRALGPKRSEIRLKEYVATLLRRKEFGDRLAQVHSEVVGLVPHEVVVMGDGARWIWELAKALFPDSTEILDFYHVCEYVWDVARACLPETAREPWVKQQTDRLKASHWEEVRRAASDLPRSTSEAKEAVRALRRYLKNNRERIDYKTYIQKGLMIGSGVIESSNRRVVAQRCKQAGMHWSLAGADAVMGLRAAYLSDSKRWQHHWHPETAQPA